MSHEIEITKYPYLGYSRNLIEFFLIIGYEKNYIKTEILPTYLTNINQVHEPTILNTIISNNEIDMLDNDMILKLIFPKPPLILSSTNLLFEPANQSIVFFLNADTMTTQSKIPFHGCAYIFYEYFVVNSTKIFIPKTFCIISQYPFFTIFNNLNKDILKHFRSKNNEISLEILLYNIINFVPSPINFSVNVNLFPREKDLSAYTTNINISMQNMNISGGISNSTTSLPLLKSNSLSSAHLHHVQNIPQLIGYPLLDFNLVDIFLVMPINMVVEILIFNFLEIDMLFFSKNLEILNMSMYIIMSLNYPCNDSIYLWHILSVSKEELLTTDTSQFVGKPWASMLGVNCTYDSIIDTNKIVEQRFIVDLDNRNFFYKPSTSEKDNEDCVKTKQLFDYIKKIVKDYNVSSFFLSKNIKNLLKELDIITKQIITHTPSQGGVFNINLNITTNTNYAYNNVYNSSFIQNTYYNADHNYLQINFFESSDKVKILNKNIQEAFYDFILNILIVFYNNYYLNSSFDKKKKKEEGQPNTNFFIHYNEDITKFSKEEIVFYSFFKSSNKYNNYILNFIQEFKCIDLYKIPLIFSEEFIYLKKNNDEKIFKSRFFEIIESFYTSDQSNNNDMNSSTGFRNSLTHSTKQKPIVVNFYQFFSYYERKLKSYFYDEITEDVYEENSVVIKTNIFNQTKFTYEYDVIELDNSILFKYIYHLNNLSQDEKEEIFPSLTNKKNNDIKKIKFNEIIEAIEKNLISHKILKSDHLIIFSLIFIFSFTRSICNFNESISHLRDILELLDSRSFFLRKYINVILSIYNINTQVEFGMDKISNDNDFQNKKYDYIKKMCNFIIINFLRNKNILPNEQMMSLFENFTLQNEKDDDEFIPDILIDEDNNVPTHDLEKFNLFLQYHYCRCGTKKPEYFIKLSENSTYDGDLILDCNLCQTKETKTGLVFKFDFSTTKIMTEIFSPLKLYNMCYKMFNEYLSTNNFYALDREIINKIIINLIFYCKNLGMTYKFLLKFVEITSTINY